MTRPWWAAVGGCARGRAPLAWAARGGCGRGRARGSARNRRVICAHRLRVTPLFRQDVALDAVEQRLPRLALERGIDVAQGGGGVGGERLPRAPGLLVGVFARAQIRQMSLITHAPEVAAGGKHRERLLVVGDPLG